MLEGYNLVELEKITFINLITDLRNFLTFFIFYLWVPILYLLILKLKKKHILLSNLFRKKDLIDYFIISIIFFTSIFPYMLANRSTDLFFISDYNDFTNAFKIYRKEALLKTFPLVSESFNIFLELPLKIISRKMKYKIIPISWTNRKEGNSKFDIKELRAKYLFTLIYCLLEKLLLKK